MITALALAGVACAGCSTSSRSSAGPSRSSAGATSSSRPASAGTYGSLPSFLPSDAVVPVDQVLTGTPQRPAVTVQGEAARVVLADGSTALMNVVGPATPGQGLRFVTPSTTCTWTVTIDHVHGRIPVRVADFTAQDHLGHYVRPALVPGDPRPAAELTTAQHVSFRLRAGMITGEGVMFWNPAGGRTVASWDFTAEND